MNNPRTITEGQMKLLSDIFRLIAKEITCDEDKYNLAPGEIGVSYTEGSFYIRDPHTGELFCPNSLSHLKQILSKYDPTTNILNADWVSDIRFYSSLSQLNPIGTTMSADTIIRQMEYPGFLMAPIEYESYASYGFPAGSGIMIVNKISPEYVTATFTDCSTYAVYDGRYNKFKHLFEGWSLASGLNTIYIETSGGGDTTSITGPDDLRDLLLITVRVTEDLNPGATIIYNNGPEIPIINQDGTPLNEAILANNIIMLIYDDRRKGWILLRSTDSSIDAIISVMNERIKILEQTIGHNQDDFSEKLSELKNYIDGKVTMLKARPGTIVTYPYEFTAATNTDTVNAIPNFNPTYDKLVVNYNQTILRPELDYRIETNGGITTTFTIPAGDKLYITVIKQADATQ